MAPKLISATPSAYARMNRIAFMEKGVDFELINEVPWNDDTQTPTYNPLEKLPILIFDDGSHIYDSALIQEYIVRKYADKGPPLLPEGFDAYLQARQIMTLAVGQMDAMALTFFENSREVKSPDWADRQGRKVDGAMKAYNEYVKAAKGGWLVDDTYSIADIAVGCAAEWVDFFGIRPDWRKDHPELAEWLAKVSEKDTFKDTTPGMLPP